MVKWYSSNTSVWTTDSQSTTYYHEVNVEPTFALFQLSRGSKGPMNNFNSIIDLNPRLEHVKLILIPEVSCESQTTNLMFIAFRVPN